VEEDSEEGEEAKVAVEGDAKKNVKLFKVRLRTWSGAGVWAGACEYTGIDLVYYLSCYGAPGFRSGIRCSVFSDSTSCIRVLRPRHGWL
jgi:hypothetical protein